MTIFKLPDLGEGLPDAEIVQWLVAEGDEVTLDQPLVSMETAKAVVEVPSPVTGRVVRFYGQAGDVIQTGTPLVEFSVDGEEPSAPAVEEPLPASAEEPLPEEESLPEEDSLSEDDLDLAAVPDEDPEEDAGDDDVLAASLADDLTDEADSAAADVHGPDDLYDEFGGGEPGPEPAAEEAPEEPAESRDDSGTVVGNVQSGNEVLQERTSEVGGVRVTPAVRALARKLRVDIGRVQPSGSDGVVTAADVRQAAEAGTASVDAPAPAPSPSPAPSASPAPGTDTQAAVQPEPAEPAEPAQPAAPAPTASAPEQAAADEWTPVRGPRRTMARVMSESHRSIVPTTLMDDADIHAWRPGEDVTARLIRALWAGARAEPGLNAWFDGENGMRLVHKNMHVGMAVDTEDGLFVAALRNVNRLERAELRQEINRLRENAANRSIPPEDLKDYTIILSNFGKFAGRYATPVITPPCVSIVAAGALRHEVVPVLGGIEVHRMIPLSLTFDHRACTGGEAARFLKAMLDDLARAE